LCICAVYVYSGLGLETIAVPALARICFAGALLGAFVGARVAARSLREMLWDELLGRRLAGNRTRLAGRALCAGVPARGARFAAVPQVRRQRRLSGHLQPARPTRRHRPALPRSRAAPGCGADASKAAAVTAAESTAKMTNSPCGLPSPMNHQSFIRWCNRTAHDTRGGWVCLPVV